MASLPEQRVMYTEDPSVLDTLPTHLTLMLVPYKNGFTECFGTIPFSPLIVDTLWYLEIILKSVEKLCVKLRRLDNDTFHWSCFYNPLNDADMALVFILD